MRDHRKKKKAQNAKETWENNFVGYARLGYNQKNLGFFK